MESLFLLPPPLFWGEESIREFLRSVDEANFLLEDYFPKGHGLHNRESLIDSIGRHLARESLENLIFLWISWLAMKRSVVLTTNKFFNY